MTKCCYTNSIIIIIIIIIIITVIIVITAIISRKPQPLSSDRQRQQATKVYHVDSSVQSVVYLVMPDYRITASSYLNPGQRIAIDVIILNQAAAFSKDVYASLVTVVDLVFPTQQTAALKVVTWRKSMSSCTYANVNSGNRTTHVTP